MLKEGRAVRTNCELETLSLKDFKHVYQLKSNEKTETYPQFQQGELTKNVKVDTN